MESISLKEVVSDFAHELNKLAPVVERALTAGGLTQAFDALQDIDQQMDAIKHHYHRCMAVRDLLRKEGYGRIVLIK